jgi:hypothetical protein
MDISIDQCKLNGNQAGLFLTIMQTLGGLVRWLTGFFMLTEEDRLKAGIYLGGEGRD